MLLGRHLTLNDFCNCTTTYKLFQSQIESSPQQKESISALKALAIELLDPLIDHYGRERFKLTYGFCSNDLRKKLESKNPETGKRYGRVSPRDDQHMAHELNSKGNPYCKRPGAACDFRIEGEDSYQVIAKIIDLALPFDRIYFYGHDRSIHLSHGPDHCRYLCGFNNKDVPAIRPVKELRERAKKVYSTP